jgi:hypothetical protein
VGNGHDFVARVFPLGENLTVDESFEKLRDLEWEPTIAAHTLRLPSSGQFSSLARRPSTRRPPTIWPPGAAPSEKEKNNPYIRSFAEGRRLGRWSSLAFPGRHKVLTKKGMRTTAFDLPHL